MTSTPAPAPLKISFCTSCKGRAHHVRETLPANLAATADDPDVEFVLLDYQSDDGLGEWVAETQTEALRSGRLVYARMDVAPTFWMAHAKNVSHRLASGDVLCNLDADNLLPDGYSHYLRRQFTGRGALIVAPRRMTAWDFISQRVVERLLGLRRTPAGLNGRIAVDRPTFYRLGGYDEAMRGWSPEDADFRLRARDAGVPQLAVPRRFWGDVLHHDDEARFAHYSGDDLERSRRFLGRGLWTEFRERQAMIARRHPPVANAGGFGCTPLRLNFSTEVTTLGPLTMETNE